MEKLYVKKYNVSGFWVLREGEKKIEMYLKLH